MLYREIGKTGVKASILGFGCMRLPVLENKHEIDEEKAAAMFEYAVANGINYFDTAYSYHADVAFQKGMSEVFLGKAIKGYRDRIHLATKLPCWLIKSRSDMDKYLDEQLERLQTDHIDFYLLHGLNKSFWKKLTKLGFDDFLAGALADGRIRHAGFSFHDELPLFREIVDAYDWSFCQIQYNFMDENFQAGRAGLEYAAAKGLGVIVMEPLRGGNLTERIPPDVQRIWERAAVVRTPAEWGLRFVWNRPEVSVALSGMTTMEHLRENIRIAGLGQPHSLTAGELGLISEVKSVYEAGIRVNCTGCRYCMPCPAGVDIPSSFLQLNNASMYGDWENGKFFYKLFVREEQRASRCIQCGQCEQTCPQHIPIREKLKEVADALEHEGTCGN